MLEDRIAFNQEELNFAELALKVSGAVQAAHDAHLLAASLLDGDADPLVGNRNPNIVAGFFAALERLGSVAVQIDGDGQHDPAFLDALLAPIREGKAALVVGSRFLQEGGYRSTAIRRAATRSAPRDPSGRTLDTRTRRRCSRWCRGG